MQEVSDLERRITAALQRISLAAEGAQKGGPSAREADLAAEAEELRSALLAERGLAAQLRGRVEELENRGREEQQLHESEIGALKAIHAAQSRDLVILAEQLKSDLAELQAQRQAEAEEVAQILAALGPLVKEAQDA